MVKCLLYKHEELSLILRTLVGKITGMVVHACNLSTGEGGDRRSHVATRTATLPYLGSCWLVRDPASRRGVRSCLSNDTQDYPLASMRTYTLMVMPTALHIRTHGNKNSSINGKDCGAIAILCGLGLVLSCFLIGCLHWPSSLHHHGKRAGRKPVHTT